MPPARSRSWCPTTATNASGTRRCRCCSNATSASRTGPSPFPGSGRCSTDALATAGLTDAGNRPLTFSPHDFRRLFITDAIVNGMPPHIAQLVVGHRDIKPLWDTRRSIPRRSSTATARSSPAAAPPVPARSTGPPPTRNGNDFLGHFERRRVALGDCGRAYGTSCVHEHSCLRCSLLRPDPGQAGRILEIREGRMLGGLRPHPGVRAGDRRSRGIRSAGRPRRARESSVRRPRAGAVLRPWA